MPFDAAPERGHGGGDDFTFTLRDDIPAGWHCALAVSPMPMRLLEFTAATDMPKGTECTIRRVPGFDDVRMLSYHLSGIAAEFIVIAKVERL